MILGGEVLTNGITLCLLVIRGIHQGFFVRPFPPFPSQPPSSSSSSLLFNKRFRIETLLGSHLRPLPPPSSFVDRNGAWRGVESRVIYWPGEGGDTSGWKARRQCWKYHICFIGPVLRPHCTRQGALYPVAWETVGAVSSPPRNTGDRHPGSRLVLFYYGCPSVPGCQVGILLSWGGLCCRVTMRTIVYPRDISRVGDFCLD